MSKDNTKKPTVLDVLERVSGLSKPDIGQILAEVKANQKLLHECKPPHNFVPIPPESKLGLTRDYVCTKCRGKVEASKARWYIEGLEHGRKKK